ncbi:MAG TPA: hypothetical protein VL854_10490 [Nitrososphaeraceae archaeon]|nr:hypothetical protein [Nitrososphaeraceae archaeon]
MAGLDEWASSQELVDSQTQPDLQCAMIMDELPISWISTKDEHISYMRGSMKW